MGVRILVLLALIISAYVVWMSYDLARRETHHSLDSVNFDQKRNFTVYVPRSYSSTKQRYPVLYVLDGERLRNNRIAAGISSSLSSIASAPEMIIVSVHGDGERSKDYMPNNALSAYTNKVTKGRADIFSRYLTEELIPSIDRDFRTNEFRVISGHSLAGLFVMDLFAQNSGVFQGYFAYSPTFTHDQKSLQRLSQRPASRNNSVEPYLYMNIGYESELYTHYFQQAERIIRPEEKLELCNCSIEYHFGVFHPFIMMTGQLSGLLDMPRSFDIAKKE